MLSAALTVKLGVPHGLHRRFTTKCLTHPACSALGNRLPAAAPQGSQLQELLVIPSYGCPLHHVKVVQPAKPNCPDQKQSCYIAEDCACHALSKHPLHHQQLLSWHLEIFDTALQILQSSASASSSPHTSKTWHYSRRCSRHLPGSCWPPQSRRLSSNRMHVPFWQLLLLTHLVSAAHWLLVEGLLLGYCWRGAIASSSHWGCLGGGCHVESFESRACSQIRLAGQGMVTEPKPG